MVVCVVRAPYALQATIRQRVRSPDPRRVHFIQAVAGSCGNKGHLFDTSDREIRNEHSINRCFIVFLT